MPETIIKIKKQINQLHEQAVNGIPTLIGISLVVLLSVGLVIDNQTKQAEPMITATAVTEFVARQPEPHLDLTEVALTRQPTEEQKQQWAERINAFSLEVGSPLKDQYGMVWVETGIKYNRHPYALVAIWLILHLVRILPLPITWVM